jgi:hypothetical protein
LSENVAGNALINVSNDLLPFMVGQSLDSFSKVSGFTLLVVKDVMLFHIVSRQFK